MNRTTRDLHGIVLTIAIVNMAMVGASSAQEQLEFELAVVGIEVGTLSPEGQKTESTDFELQAFADFTGTVSWQIHNPAGAQILASELNDKARQQGGSELFFASQPNHPYDPATYPGETLESFLERFPAGAYTFTGQTKDGARLESNATLTHLIPAHPEVEIEINQDERITFSWPAVTECFRDVPCQGVEIAEYSVKVSEADITREGTFDDGGFTNGADRYLEGHYVPTTICSDGRCELSLSTDFFIEGNTYEWQVFAIEKSGNSTYRASEFTFATAVPEPSAFVMGWFAVATLLWLRHHR